MNSSQQEIWQLRCRRLSPKNCAKTTKLPILPCDMSTTTRSKNRTASPHFRREDKHLVWSRSRRRLPNIYPTETSDPDSPETAGILLTPAFGRPGPNRSIDHLLRLCSSFQGLYVRSQRRGI